MKYNSYPPAAENIVVDESLLSPYSLECHKILHGKEKYSEKKLTATFLDKERYTLSHMNLKTYLEMGLELVAVHKVLQFTQAPFIKKYIDICTNLRSKATSPFRKNFYKLMANSVSAHNCLMLCSQ